MTPGLLDLPAPLFDALDDLTADLHIPVLLRILAYACACAWIGMRVYRRFSDQPRLLALRAEIAAVQSALARHDGRFAELGVLIRRNLSLSLRQLGLTLIPALLASLPLLLVLPWLSNRFDYASPLPDTSVNVCVQPPSVAATLHWQAAQAIAHGSGCWRLTWPATGDTAMLMDSQGTPLHAFVTPARSAFIYKYTKFNRLIGNPDGYLPATAAADRLAVALHAREVFPSGSAWLRGWEIWYFGMLVLVSLALKLRWRLR
jgi:hypothetical protein